MPFAIGLERMALDGSPHNALPALRRGVLGMLRNEGVGVGVECGGQDPGHPAAIRRLRKPRHPFVDAPSMQAISERFEHVIGCGHVSAGEECI